MSPMSALLVRGCRLGVCVPNQRASCSGSPAICRVRRSWRNWSQAGYGVESVDGHRQLEEVFMSLVGTSDQQAEHSDDGAS